MWIWCLNSYLCVGVRDKNICMNLVESSVLLSRFFVCCSSSNFYVQFCCFYVPAQQDIREGSCLFVCNVGCVESSIRRLAAAFRGRLLHAQLPSTCAMPSLPLLRAALCSCGASYDPWGCRPHHRPAAMAHNHQTSLSSFVEKPLTAALSLFALLPGPRFPKSSHGDNFAGSV